MVKKRGFYNGEYIVENKEKYIGNKNPIYRSSYESRVCYFYDHNPNVIKWSYEAIEILYFNVIDKKVHRYYPDFYVEMIDKNKELKKYIVEVKPSLQTEIPKQPKNGKATKRYIYEAHAFVVNQCKWQAAEKYCKQMGYTFKLITENDIFQ